jgi:hypothetical protein
MALSAPPGRRSWRNLATPQSGAAILASAPGKEKALCHGRFVDPVQAAAWNGGLPG